jgi:hypothetical protein
LLVLEGARLVVETAPEMAEIRRRPGCNIYALTLVPLQKAIAAQRLRLIV